MQPGGTRKERGGGTLAVLGYVLCCWPFVLVFFGGAIGGAIGGGAAGLNLMIYRSRLPTIMKIPVVIIIGLMGVCAWITIGGALTT
ncbi:MAG: hypothetical protein E3J64_01625 [Anaerolineales bacterium]|nr:MAG: hypothetical protein E3J64_01625 [Anaerolineales bacterium]